MSNLRDQQTGLLEGEAFDTAYPTSSSVNGSEGSINTGRKDGCCAWIMQKLFKGNAKVALYALGLLFFSTGNSIFFKKMTDKMENYPYFLSQLTTFVYLPVFFGIVLYELKFTQNITQEMKDFPKKKFLFMGLFDALSGICMLFGGVHTSGSFQALLNNAVIPITMGLSILILRTKYVKTQYAGALTILGGVCLVLIPTIVHPKKNDGDNQILFNGIFLLSTIPTACSSIYKELAFGDVELGVNWLQAWVALFQFFLGLLLVPVNALPFLGDNYIPFKELPYTISNGGKCLVGINTYVNHTVFNDAGIATGGSCYTDSNNKFGASVLCDDCNLAFVPVLLYVMFNCMYNLFMILVIKHGSAALVWIVLTLRLPLLQIAFAIPAIKNPPDSLSGYAIGGLFVILTGLVLYRWSSVTGGGDAKAEENALGEGEHGAIVDPNMLLSDSFNQRLTQPSAAE